MSTPPHSVEPRPSCVEGDRYTDRNNFLHLLLGLISVAEQFLAFVPDLAADPPPDGPGEPGIAANRQDTESLMR
jgi:hypothetical protein